MCTLLPPFPTSVVGILPRSARAARASPAGMLILLACPPTCASQDSLAKSIDTTCGHAYIHVISTEQPGNEDREARSGERRA